MSYAGHNVGNGHSHKLGGGVSMRETIKGNITRLVNMCTL